MLMLMYAFIPRTALVLKGSVNATYTPKDHDGTYIQFDNSVEGLGHYSAVLEPVGGKGCLLYPRYWLLLVKKYDLSYVDYESDDYVDAYFDSLIELEKRYNKAVAEGYVDPELENDYEIDGFLAKMATALLTTTDYLSVWTARSLDKKLPKTYEYLRGGYTPITSRLDL